MPVDPRPTTKWTPHPAFVIGLVPATALVILGGVFNPGLVLVVVKAAIYICVIAFAIQHVAIGVQEVRKWKAERRAHP